MLKPTDPSLFYSRQDPEDPRLGELVTTQKTENAVVLIGYPDDRGIQLNKGRGGAAEAPDRIRRYLYRMTPPAQGPRIWDLGNVEPAVTVKETHQACALHLASAYDSARLLVSLGGGHDFGYPDASTFAQWCGKNKQIPLVINLDAHLDMRPWNPSTEPHSGTPFYRALSDFPEIEMISLGLQRSCNSVHHLKWAAGQNVRALFVDELGTEAGWKKLSTWLPTQSKKRPCYLSVDVDGFSSAVAPGCSAPGAEGLMPREWQRVLELILGSCTIQHLGIYEVSPPLDRDDQTSRWAAQIIHQVAGGSPWP